jgi:adenine-specific DNA-methyltransferase
VARITLCRVVEELIPTPDMAATNGDSTANGEVEPTEPGLFLHWRGRSQARIAVPKPRVLQEVPEHSDHAEGEPGNLLIEGDNRQAMVSLMGQWRGKIDVALLDPPYNTGNEDLLYSDKRFHDPDADADDAVFVSNTDGGRHTKWLNQMAPTLRLVRDLMAPHGTLFVHVNDIELPRLLMLLEDIFDEKNHLGTIVWKNSTDNNPSRIVVEHEYIVCFAKDESNVAKQWISPEAETRDRLLEEFGSLKQELSDLAALQKQWRKLVKENATALPDLDRYTKVDERGPYRVGYRVHNPKPGGYRYDVIHPVTGQACRQPLHGYRYPEESMRQLIEAGEIIFGEDHTTIVQMKERLEDYDLSLKSVVEIDGRTGAKTLRKLIGPEGDRFRNPKPVEIEQYLLSFVAARDAVVLDPFAGTATTGHAVMRLNAKDGGGRRFILIEEGRPDDPYAVTLAAKRLEQARSQEDLPGGFTFLRVTRQIDAEGFATFQRHEIVAAIRQADASGRGTGIRPVDGTWVIGANHRNEAICLHYDGPGGGMTAAEHLRAMFEEAYALGLATPLRVYGDACEVFEDDSFVFLQIPEELLRNLSIPGRRRER